MFQRMLMVAVAVGALVLAGTAMGQGPLQPKAAEAGMAFRSVNCQFGQMCTVTWISGPGNFYVAFSGYDRNGNYIQSTRHSYCYSQFCAFTSTVFNLNPDHRFTNFVVSGPGYLAVTGHACHSVYY